MYITKDAYYCTHMYMYMGICSYKCSIDNTGVMHNDDHETLMQHYLLEWMSEWMKLKWYVISLNIPLLCTCTRVYTYPPFLLLSLQIFVGKHFAVFFLYFLSHKLVLNKRVIFSCKIFVIFLLLRYHIYVQIHISTLYNFTAAYFDGFYFSKFFF